MTTSAQASLDLKKNVAGERRYFTVMALVMIAISIAGFVPAMVDPSSRRAPLTPVAAVHGVVYFAWLVLFLVQTRLVATGRVAVHRRLGIAGVFLLALMIPLGYVTTMGMVRRGFDLSGDQGVDRYAHAGAIDPQYGAVFNLCGLVGFAVLAIAALALRRRSEIHKRLMLYATIELMAAPVTHFWGHVGVFNHVSVPVGVGLVLAPMAILLVSCVIRDYVVMRRVHPLTPTLAITMFAFQMIQGGVIGPSAGWHRFVDWLAF
jgi:hypothetical protein